MADPITAERPPGSGAAARSGAHSPPQLRAAAQEFEAMVLAQLLQPMFATVDLSKGPFGGRQGEAMWQPLLIEAVAKAIADAGGLGIADAAFGALQRAHTQPAVSAAPPDTTGWAP